MADAMTPERAREVLDGLRSRSARVKAEALETAANRHTPERLGMVAEAEYQRLAVQVAALTLALAALDALARVRALCERGPFSGSWGSGYEMALADVRRALDGEADR